MVKIKGKEEIKRVGKKSNGIVEFAARRGVEWCLAMVCLGLVWLCLLNKLKKFEIFHMDFGCNRMYTFRI